MAVLAISGGVVQHPVISTTTPAKLLVMVTDQSGHVLKGLSKANFTLNVLASPSLGEEFNDLPLPLEIDNLSDKGWFPGIYVLSFSPTSFFAWGAGGYFMILNVKVLHPALPPNQPTVDYGSKGYLFYVGP